MSTQKYSYETFGDSNAKDTIIFLHGWGGSRKSFYKLTKEILKQATSYKPQAKLRLILLDLPGFGDAEMPPEEGWTTHHYQAWFEEFINVETPKLGVSSSNLHLYGHSFGCRVIIRHLVKHHEFPGKIILTGAAGVKWPPSFKMRCTKFLNKCFSPLKVLLPGKIKKKVLRRLGAGDWADLDPALKNTFQNVLKEEDLRVYFSKIYQQVQLIWGKKDTMTPLKSAHVFHSNLPNSQLKSFSRGKHGIHHTHTEQVADVVLRFLSQ